MKITHCKLKKKVQKKLLRFFVLEVTARSAADIFGYPSQFGSPVLPQNPYGHQPLSGLGCR